MDQFTLPTESFDLTLLPEDARDPQSPRFADAVGSFFQQQFCDLGVDGVVQVSPQAISVGWTSRAGDPVKDAVALLQRGQLREGVQLLELIRRRQPNSEDALYNLGLGLSELGNFTRATEILRQLIQLAPNHVHGLVALGVALGRSGESETALQFLQRAVELAPQDIWARQNLGGILLKLGQFAEARLALATAVEIAPGQARAWLLLGEACIGLKDIPAARAALLRARELDPHSPIRDRADVLLNQLSESALPRNADGVNPEALAAMKQAITRLRSMEPEVAKRLTLNAALVGQSGLNLHDHTKRHRVEGIEEPLTGLEVACLIHAGVQLVAPGGPYTNIL
ncbi:MAG TPA: tetratricopeptide repeat protein [Verrucomicrobiota bacterium]|nr:tetratricopeptide repeat protein [Verrucomicrobiota bacterium]